MDITIFNLLIVKLYILHFKDKVIKLWLC